MSFFKNYYPNYTKKYPGVKITPEQLQALRKSDRKMKYDEVDLKTGQPIRVNGLTGEPTDEYDPQSTIIGYGYSREISLELLIETRDRVVDDLVDEYANPLVVVVRKERYRELYKCLSRLDKEERKLLNSLFWDGETEKEYGSSSGQSQPTVSREKRRVLEKLRHNYEKLKIRE